MKHHDPAMSAIDSVASEHDLVRRACRVNLLNLALGHHTLEAEGFGLRR
jgi:hypothetical protein